MSPTVSDGGEEPSQYVRIARAGSREFLPAVTIAIAKRKGANAVDGGGERAAAASSRLRAV